MYLGHFPTPDFRPALAALPGQNGTVEMAGGQLSLLTDGTLRRVGKSGALAIQEMLGISISMIIMIKDLLL